jgi:SAM-dependent methyltransferase
MTDMIACPVCNGACLPLPAVDFNKSCEDKDGMALQATGIPVSYALCTQCGFCHAPEIASWSLEQFEDRIYNAGYVTIDPDYVERRPQANSAALHAMFGAGAAAIRHLDYGGGSGLLSGSLRECGWDSSSYDPFVDRDLSPGQLGQFNLISSFEVFEHVPDPGRLMADLRTLLAPGGIVVFSTLTSDGNLQPGQRPDWWYAAPRNGHISLFSRRSLAVLAQQGGFQFASFSPGFHVYFTTVPAWASHLLKAPAPASAATPAKTGWLSGMLIRWAKRLLSG